MKKLFIIGNGFDLHFGLQTSVNDFKKLIKEKDNNEYYLMAGVDWNEYEEALSSIDVEYLAENLISGPDYLSERESDRDGVVYAVENAMDEMNSIRVGCLNMLIESAEETLNQIYLEKYEEDSSSITKKTFPDDSIFITFNYTSTLETLFELTEYNEILHLHGSFNDDEYLTFGYSSYDDEILNFFACQYVDVPKFKREIQCEDYPDPYIHKQYEAIYDFYISNQKNHCIEKLLTFIFQYKGQVDEVIVLGHSMGVVDKPYFDKLDEIICPSKWIISQYEDFPDEKFLQNNYSFADRIVFCEITDYL